MKISLNEIRKMNQLNNSTGDIALHGIENLVEKIGAQLGSVDEVIEIGKKYRGIIIVKIISCEKHPNADKLKICLVDDNRKAKNVQRNENGYVQVVCGAPNARAGLMAVWLPPGVTVPVSVTKNPLVIEARDIRGQISNGMLASANELAISDDHSGIIELDETHIQPGDDFALVMGLDDYIIDIENKMFTHRPDLFGMLGVARELAGIQHIPYKSPEWYVENPDIPGIEAEKLELYIQNELPELVPRFTAIVLSGVKVEPSPLWLQLFLAKIGQKPINNIVDYTNFFMHVTSQPLHAYDYDKVASLSGNHATIVIRSPKKGEKIRLLNGKSIEPREEAIMIATDKTLLGIGGVMGGVETEVDENTKNIILECAHFDMYSIRRTSMAHGLFTDAVTRFTKGQSIRQTKAVLAKITDEIRTHASGKIASECIDVYNKSKAKRDSILSIESSFINERLGFKLSADKIAALLQNVEFKIKKQGESLEIVPPFWRTDITIPEDIVEEVGRLYGYDHLPLVLPTHSIIPTAPDAMLKIKQRLRHIFASLGANETLTYSFVPGSLIEKTGQSKDEAYQISNALSPDLQYYRLSLTPSLLSHVHHNVKSGYENFCLFELGKTHSKKQENEQDVPKEIDTLSFVAVKSKKDFKATGSPFYSARRYLDEIAKKCGIELVYYPVERDPGLAMTAPFDLSRSAFVTIKDSKWMLGIVGEYNSSVHKNLKLPPYASGFELGIQELLDHTKSQTTYKPLNRYPGTWQDICFQVAATTPYKDLYVLVSSVLSGVQLDSRLMAVDIYQPESKEYKNITLRVHLTDRNKTITAEEIRAVTEKIARAASEQLQAKII